VEHAEDVQLDPPPYLGELTRLLADMPEAMSIADAVVADNFGAASYRLSLLAFINEQNVDPELAPLAALPLRVQWDESYEELAPVNRNGVAAMSPGHLVPLQEKNP